MKRIAGITVAVAVLLGSMAAQAIPTSHFEFDGVTGPDLSFDLPTDPTPDAVGANRFDIVNIHILVNGIGPDTINTLRFFLLSSAGGFNTSGLSTNADTTGPQLFSGTLTAPEFNPGVYILSPGFSGGDGGTLTITAQDVPEPITVTMFGIGLVGLAAVRRRQRK